MGFKVITDLTVADALAESGVLWYDVSPLAPLDQDGNPADGHGQWGWPSIWVYRAEDGTTPSSYLRGWAEDMCRFYILVED